MASSCSVLQIELGILSLQLWNFGCCIDLGLWVEASKLSDLLQCVYPKVPSWWAHLILNSTKAKGVMDQSSACVTEKTVSHGQLREKREVHVQNLISYILQLCDIHQ